MTGDQDYSEPEVYADLEEELLVMSAVADPVLAELWDNERDARYNVFSNDDSAQLIE